MARIIFAVLVVVLWCGGALGQVPPTPPDDFEMPGNYTNEGRCFILEGCRSSAQTAGYSLYGCNTAGHPITQYWSVDYIYSGWGCLGLDGVYHVWWHYPLLGEGGTPADPQFELSGAMSLFFGIMTAAAFILGVKTI